MARQLDSMPPCCPCPAGLLQPSYLPRRPHQPRGSGGGLARAALVISNMHARLNCTQVKMRRPATLRSPKSGSWRSGWYGGDSAVGVLATSLPPCAFESLVAARRRRRNSSGAVVACASRHRLAAIRRVSLCLSICLSLASLPVSRSLCLPLLSAVFVFLSWWLLPFRRYLRWLRRGGPGYKGVLQSANVPLRAEQQQSLWFGRRALLLTRERCNVLYGNQVGVP